MKVKRHIEKVVRDGKVAVLVSPGYGAGWSTWNICLAEDFAVNLPIFGTDPAPVIDTAVLAEELLARKKLSAEVAGRLSEKVLLIRPGRLDAVLDELRKMGHTPQVVGK